MTKKDDPLNEYYDSWRSTVAEVQGYIIKQEIPSIDEITPEGKFVFQTELNWNCIMTPRRDGTIKNTPFRYIRASPLCPLGRCQRH